MPIKILMPALSPTMTAGNLAKWVKQEGEKITPGDVIAEIETDKAVMEVEAVDEGVLAKILVPAGTEKVNVNSIIAVVLESGETQDDLEKFLDNMGNNAKASTEHSNSNSVISNLENGTTIRSEKSLSKSDQDKISTKIFASPLAKKIALDSNIDLSKIQGSGPNNRIIKQDILSVINSTTNISDANQVGYTLIPHTNMRKIIAERLIESKQSIPHFYLTLQCRLDELLKARIDINQQYNIKISINDFIIKAVAKVMSLIPEVNSSWEDAGIRQYNTIDISIAVATNSGLITPIVKNADKKSLIEISKEVKELVARAKENKLKLEEFQGGGFSISNLGMYGIKQFNAIINPPQSCILAVGASMQVPVIVDNQIVISSVMELTLSCDHRIIDGVIGAKFLNKLQQFIETPILILT